ncbi:MAG TPA: DUF1634 domain-containing protein [Gemmataceae bacterium]|nr:DUF1634 domain-containing protein [Gemmataceae bacterium]
MDTPYEANFEQLLAKLLRAGVLLSAGVVCLGAILYLINAGGADAREHKVFKKEQPADLRTVEAVVTSALRLDGLAVIEVGLFLLVATPVARVAFSVYGFLRERDWVYVAMTLFVLAVLLYSLFFDAAH